MKSYVLPLLAGILLLLPACKDDDETPGTCSVSSPNSLEYIPLQIGNYWIYDWHFLLRQRLLVNSVLRIR